MQVACMTTLEPLIQQQHSFFTWHTSAQQSASRYDVQEVSVEYLCNRVDDKSVHVQEDHISCVVQALCHKLLYESNLPRKDTSAQ